MTDLAAWLLERVSADEAAARALLRRSQDVQLQLADPKVLGLYIPGWHDWPDVEAMCVRVIAEADAKRRIVIRCQEMQLAAVPMAVHLATQTLASLALPHADSPGYDEAWAPQ